MALETVYLLLCIVHQTYLFLFSFILKKYHLCNGNNYTISTIINMFEKIDCTYIQIGLRYMKQINK